MAFIGVAHLVAQDAGHQPGHGVGHGHGGNLAAGEDEVPQGDLLVHALVDEPLVDALVVAADQNQIFHRVPQAHGVFLGEGFAAGGEVDGVDRAADLVADGLPAAVEGIGLEDGSVAAAVGVVVHLVLLAGRVVPDLPGLNANQVPLLGPAQDALVHHIAHGVGEERENVNPHLLPSLR